MKMTDEEKRRIKIMLNSSEFYNEEDDGKASVWRVLSVTGAILAVLLLVTIMVGNGG